MTRGGKRTDAGRPPVGTKQRSVWLNDDMYEIIKIIKKMPKEKYLKVKEFIFSICK